VQENFSNAIQQLLAVYPLEHKTGDTLFWSAKALNRDWSIIWFPAVGCVML
jgi:hypothetical protein